ncbi:MAG: protein translocase subunit SecD [Candidatus Pacebacteria bacterium]|nr:protein translocase subunit SecD [Candidatus Paceibacterota bacterium]
MNYKKILIIFGIFIATILLGVFIYPQGMTARGIKLPDFFYKDFNFGLDISGGTLLIYEADLSNVDSADYSSAMTGLRDVIESRRINYSGVREPRVTVNKSGEAWRLTVELAGKDIQEAIKMIGETPYLEFKEIRSEEETEAILEDEELTDVDPYFKATALTGKYLERADIDFDQTTSLPVINLKFNDEGSKIFAELTKNNIGNPLAIYLDDYPISIPVVREEIPSGIAQISGEFTLAEARELAARLNQGALPVPISLISQQSVGAILGEESIKKISQAALFGFLLVILFMSIFYRFPGLLASISLIIYVILVLSIFKFIPVTLTLAGVTGFILSIGMAVDANVLIFEYAKEEMRKNKPMWISMEDGFQRSWSAIRDSNIATIISAIILYYFSSSMIRGFALTLAIGVGAGLLTAIYITRIFLQTFIINKQ